MYIIKLFVAVPATVTVCMAAIVGTVTDTSGVALPQALVRLEKGGAGRYHRRGGSRYFTDQERHHGVEE